MKKALLCIFIATALVSCISNVNATVGPDDTIAVENTTEFSNSFNELAESFSDFADVKNLTNQDFNCKFTTGELLQALNDADCGNILSIKDENDTRHYMFEINKNNYLNLGKLFPLLENEKVQIYTAAYNEDSDSEEYLEMLDFVFGEDIRDSFEKSYFTINIHSDKPIVEKENMASNGENDVSFTGKAIDFALLKEPIRFSFAVNVNASKQM